MLGATLLVKDYKLEIDNILTKINVRVNGIQNVQSRDIERRQTHQSTQHRIQNVQSRDIERRQIHRSTQHRIQNIQSRDIERRQTH